MVIDYLSSLDTSTPVLNYPALFKYLCHFPQFERRGDEIWGRGSCDAKGSMAAQIIAVETLLKGLKIKEGDVALLYVVGEEEDGAGMRAANDLGLSWEVVIFGEPTELKLASGHKGGMGISVAATLRLESGQLIRFLLDVYGQLDDIVYPATAKIHANQIRSSVRGHLKWVFNMAQRPHGYWHRSYLANGVPKDGPVFQQDQQCYPLLEICDFYDAFPSERKFVESILSAEIIPLILEMLEEHRDSTTGLYMTDETPGDDAVEHPFHFSSHVLLWHTFVRLSALIKSFPAFQQVQYVLLDSKAAKLREFALGNFIGRNPQTVTTMFAYLTDGAGQHTFYHDANDIPTLFAPDWTFIDSDLYDLWVRTMDFALSPLNAGGFYPDGKFGGLGSVHTRGPWPLGYAQELIYANIMGRNTEKEDAWRRIKGSMFWDGLFPEAVDCHTGDCVSKAWFSWPGSMIGTALVKFHVEVPTESTL